MPLHEAARLELRLYLPAVLIPSERPDPTLIDYIIGSQGHDRNISMPTKEVVIGDGALAVKVKPTHRGRPAAIDGPVTVTFSDPSVFTSTVDPDGVTIRFQDQGIVGSTDALISADVKAGPDVVTKEVMLTLQAIEGDADMLDLEIGEQGTDGGTPAPPVEPAPPV